MSSRYTTTGFVLLAAFAAAAPVAHAQNAAMPGWEQLIVPQQPSAPMMIRPAAPTVTVSNHPAWAEETLEPTNHANVLRVEPGPADVVVLDSGLYHGIRTGMKCIVEHNGESVAEIVIVASEPQKAAGLITAGTEVRSGDSVRMAFIRAS